MSQEPVDKLPSTSIWIQVMLCAWMAAIVILFLILFWPPYLAGLAQALGIWDKLQLLLTILTPFFTAKYLS